MCTKSKTLPENAAVQPNTRYAYRRGRQNKRSEGEFYAFAPKKVLYPLSVQVKESSHRVLFPSIF